MSTEETDEKKEVVQRSPSNQGTVVVEKPTTVTTTQAAPTSERQESVVRHTSTNTGAIAAMVIGVIVLIVGMGVIASQVRFLPYPYDLIVILGFGLILLLVGASMISRGTERT